MVKRICKILLFIPVCFLSVVQIVFFILKWVYDGKEFIENEDDILMEKLFQW